jgi:hypothetical protein
MELSGIWKKPLKNHPIMGSVYGRIKINLRKLLRVPDVEIDAVEAVVIAKVLQADQAETEVEEKIEG